MTRVNKKRSGKDAGGGGPNGGGGKRGIPLEGWEKGDIARDMVIQADDAGVPRKPGSPRIDRTIDAPSPGLEPSPTGAIAGHAVQFQFNSDNRTDGAEPVARRIEEITRARLSRIEGRLTRIEVHVGDVNGPRGGDDKRCVVEVRANGMAPIAAAEQGASVEGAVAAAADKVLAAFDRQIGKRTTRKGH